MPTGTMSDGAKSIVQAEQFDQTSRIVDCTASTLTVTKLLHDNKIITLNRAAGIAVTLPAATGIGSRYVFFIGTTVTSNTTTITRAGSDTMFGTAILAADGGDTVVGFEAAGSSVITMNGSTTGGVKGSVIELTDVASATWHVRVRGSATGTEATPFS